MSEWSVAEPRKLTFDAPVTALHVRIVNGTVNVVGTDEGSTRLEVSEVEGPPLTVTQQDGTLTVAYDDLPWKGFLKWLDRRGWRRSAVVSLAVPASTRVEVGVIGANAMVSGIDGSAEVKGVTGETTLVGLSGPIRATTVSGSVEAQGVAGELRLNSVSGDLTVIEGACPLVKADSVSGSIILDLDPTSGPTDARLTNVSGEIAIRLPHPVDAEVEANTASGAVSNAFEDLRMSGQWGAKRITGRLGGGNGRLQATTVSGSIALLRRPPTEDEPWDAIPEPRDTPEPHGPADTFRPRDTPPAHASPGTSSGTADTSGRSPDGTTGGPTERKEL
ncbi:DUF4097 family beta strand repeat-containing protein [Streptomyces colonosanans]|uniref:DUF4097 domain-containing protein n=1 Tax=Streptomyces colonosanans TaxID=1428652 RepID=A0A1S2NXV3_9ACTN|nr:DUF4097 family beta strand repeat-containing protein [Streptomyces colonosanans]OIJ86025.1 hypothetical protein BIV24_27435 [Streptomyces colonosanans]